MGERGLKKKLLLIRRPTFFYRGTGGRFPLVSLPARIRIRSRAMATDPPDRPTFAALQREHGGDQPHRVAGVRTKWSGDTGRRSHRCFMPPHSADFCFTCPRSMAASPTPPRLRPQPEEDDTGLPTRSYAQNPIQAIGTLPPNPADSPPARSGIVASIAIQPSSRAALPPQDFLCHLQSRSPSASRSRTH